MPLTLPVSPTVGQKFDTPSGQLTWDGLSWKRDQALPAAPTYRVTVGIDSAKPLTGNTDGDIYVVAGDSTASLNGKTFVWSNSTSSWLDISAAPPSFYDADFVNLTGDTMTGQLTLGKNPVDPFDAVPKSWLESRPKPAYANTGYGGTVIQTGSYREHVWTNTNGNDLFIVEGVISNAEILIIGGGGGGGAHGGGGGGSGGLISLSGQTLTGNYFVSAGNGGIGGPVNAFGSGTGGPGDNGGNSVFGSYTAFGGGGGGGYYGSGAGVAYPGFSGGAGGGGGPGFGGGAAGASNGGQGSGAGAGSNNAGGGGGGVAGGGQGGVATLTKGGNGGGPTTVLGRSIGGGGGGGAFAGITPGLILAGNGGAGSNNSNGANAIANTGGGGGGGGAGFSGGAGAGGLIVVRYVA